jgi:glycosyltransferase involved in cell wall biosynthesis
VDFKGQKTGLKTLLYIGSMRVMSMMEEHGALLETHFKVFYSSSRKNKWLRLLDMVSTFLKTRREVDGVIISVYSTLNFYYAWIIAQLCRLFRKPFIAYLHGGNLPHRLEKSPWMSQTIFSHSVANVAPSGYLKTAFERSGFTVKLIPNFIQIENYPFRLRAKLRPRLLWVRAFEQCYHPEMSIWVFAQIQKKYPNARLSMVGPDKDGSLQTCKNLTAGLGLSAHINFTGALPKPEWIALAADYDLFISTTRFDNTPISILEAMALGLPIVSTDVGGMPFLLEHGKDGLLSPDGDIPAMVGHIEHLLDSPDLALSIGQNARQKAERFDWKVVEKQWLELLNRA